MVGIEINRAVYFLKELEDVVGILSDVTHLDGYPVATIGGVTVSVSEGIADELPGLIGSRVGVLRDDTGAYRLRTFSTGR